MLEEGKTEPVLKPYVLQDALATVAKEQGIPELHDAPITKHLSHCQEVVHANPSRVHAQLALQPVRATTMPNPASSLPKRSWHREK